jgi:hypothetical protein
MKSRSLYYHHYCSAKGMIPSRTMAVMNRYTSILISATCPSTPRLGEHFLSKHSASLYFTIAKNPLSASAHAKYGSLRARTQKSSTSLVNTHTHKSKNDKSEGDLQSVANKWNWERDGAWCFTAKIHKLPQLQFG